MTLDDMNPGITEKKDKFIAKLQKRYKPEFWAMLALPPEAGASKGEVSTYFCGQGLHLNAGEFENLYKLFPGDPTMATADLEAFIAACSAAPPGTVSPVWFAAPAESPNTAHLALSGRSTMEFGIQFKPYPKHWGKPPNAQMKGHSGVMRDLPGGYGKGNEPMAKWVKENLTKDKETATTEMGLKPYPLGNYSL